MPKPIYTIDVETDPFDYGSVPKAFACGIYDGKGYLSWWGADCIAKMMAHIYHLPPGMIYAHNGGRFDFFFILDYILGTQMVIKGSRIIKAHYKGRHGDHEIRDSYAILPFSLGSYKGSTQKKEIDINKLHRDHREKNRPEIEEYLKYDCITLHILVAAFIKTFTAQLTIGSTAMKEVKKLHTFDTLDAIEDNDIRSKYFYGGRVQCFESGVISGDFKVYDVNSMYPFVMRDYQHPIGKPTHESKSIEDSTCFITVEGENRNVFPMRNKNGGITFDVPYGIFHVTIHEWRVAMRFGLFTPSRIIRCINYEGRTANFSEFVTKFYNLRKEARVNKDELYTLFWKFILNSGYGKFAQNPEKFEENTITAVGEDLTSQGWEPSSVEHGEKYIIWSRPSTDARRYNVATGASITGAARSVLMTGLCTAQRAVYCDTDSIICEGLDQKLSDEELGAWKLEAECDTAAICGKKLYALFDYNKKRNAKRFEKYPKLKTKQSADGSLCVKQANKGVSVTPDDIWNIACGETVQTFRDAPSFKLDGSHVFIKRRVRMTHGNQ